MNNHELIWELQKRIVEIYRQENLIPLRGLDNSYKLNGREILPWFHNATFSNAARYGLHKNYFSLENDLFFCSDEMVYFTAHLFLYRPYINNPLHDAHDFLEGRIFPNHQNIESKRYSMFADIVSEKTYNYWDRIGDLIASYFPAKFKSKQIYFATAVDAIPAEFHSSPNFMWLMDFKTNEYTGLNKIRKQIVHYTTTDTSYRDRHLEIPTDEEGIAKLQADRESLPEYYKKHIELTLEGFERTLLLLDEFNQVLFRK